MIFTKDSKQFAFFLAVIIWILIWFFSSVSLLFLNVPFALACFAGFIGGGSLGVLYFLLYMEKVRFKGHSVPIVLTSILIMLIISLFFRYLLSQTSGRISMIVIIFLFDIMCLILLESFLVYRKGLK